MSGTVEGGKAAAETNKARYGSNYYQEIAKKSYEGWVKNGRKPRGFAIMSSEKHKAASAKGGQISRK